MEILFDIIVQKSFIFFEEEDIFQLKDFFTFPDFKTNANFALIDSCLVVTVLGIYGSSNIIGKILRIKMRWSSIKII